VQTDGRNRRTGKLPTERLMKLGSCQFHLAVSRLMMTGLLLCLAFFTSVYAQSSFKLTGIEQAQAEMNNGKYLKAVELANVSVEKAKIIKNSFLISESLKIRASSEIYLEKYDEAAKTLAEALRVLPQNELAMNQKALIYTDYAWLFRATKKFPESLDYSRKAVAAAPKNRYVLATHYLNTGRVMFTSGYDVSAIVWLEKAEKLLVQEKVSSVKLDTYRFLSLAWWSKLNYQTALEYAEKCATASNKTQFKYKHRQALFDLEIILSESGQEKQAVFILEKGLKLSVEEKNQYQACKFLTSLLLQSLDSSETATASVYLSKLEELNVNNLFTFEIFLGKAVIAAFRNEREEAEKFFAVSEQQENSEEFPLLYWKIVIAEKNQDWEKFIKINQELLDLTTKENFRSGLPKIYLNFARAYFRLNQRQISEKYLQKSLALIEEIRKSENYNLSLGLSENYHDAYRLLTQVKLGNSQESFELADFLKARILKDRIDNAVTKYQSVISPTVRKTLEELSLKFIDDQSFAGEIEKNEKLVTATVPEPNLVKPDLTQLDNISEFNETAVISYFFTLDKKLLAFVKERGQPIRTTYLSVSDDEINSLAKTTEEKVKNFIFFKRDGKEIYDKLLKPLNLDGAKHLVIIPDKSLWKIPFQALSSDGEKYLIEDKLISYAPSVSILLDQLKTPKPSRQTLQAFANSSFENKVLQYVNDEASAVAKIYNSKPIINATAADFNRVSEKFDILHFSMHAEVANDQPLDSFLGFRKIGSKEGRLTVEELLNTKLKKGSLVFLASCDTNNVLSGEGLVSLSWAMMGSGATTVISSQWEANDKSTAIFTKAFYEQYKQGISSAKATQKASLELIKNKSNNMHEPYYWANFTLSGDFR
jgi:CHAT domain-containing protein/tetratricopeptide (TPR) repeat protein